MEEGEEEQALKETSRNPAIHEQMIFLGFLVAFIGVPL